MEEFIYPIIDFIKAWIYALKLWPFNIGVIPATVIFLSGFFMIFWAVIYKIFFIPRLEKKLKKKIKPAKWMVGLPLISLQGIVMEISYYIVSKYINGFKKGYLTKRAFTPVVKENLDISYFSRFEIIMAFIDTIVIIIGQISVIIFFGFCIFMLVT